MVDHRHPQNALGPLNGVRVGALAREEQGAQALQLIALEMLRVRIFLLDGAEGGRRGEERGDVVFLDHAPEGAGVRRADGLALIDHGGRAMQQRRIDDVAVAHDPAHIRGRPEDLARINPVEILHGPFERDHMAAIVAHHALGDSRGAGGVEHIERIAGLERHTVGALARSAGRRHAGGPIVIAARDHGGLRLLALQQQHRVRLDAGEPDGLVEQGLVGHQTTRLDAAGRREDGLGRGVVDARRQLLGGETSEDHRMNGADARTGQHGEERLGDHGHVDNDPVALADPQIPQHSGQRADLVEQLRIGDAVFGARQGAVIDDRVLRPAPARHMAVHRVPAGVAFRVRKPVAIDPGFCVENPGWRRDPVDLASGLRPEGFGIPLPIGIYLAITAGHRRLRRFLRPFVRGRARHGNITGLSS